MKKWKKTMIVFCLASVSGLAFMTAGNMQRAAKTSADPDGQTSAEEAAVENRTDSAEGENDAKEAADENRTSGAGDESEAKEAAVENLTGGAESKNEAKAAVENRTSGAADENTSEEAAGENRADDTDDENGSNSADTLKTDRQEMVQAVVWDYLDELLGTLLKDNEKEYVSGDFASVNGYIAAKNLVARREGHKLLTGGISSVKLQDVELQDISEKEHGLEIIAYAAYKYVWENEDGQNTSRAGALYSLLLEESEGGFKVIDVDALDDVEIKMAKYSIKDIDEKEKQCKKIDAYYNEQIRNAKSMLSFSK